MKPILAFAGAFPLGALLVSCASGGRPPTPPPSCAELHGSGPRKAVVMVLWNKEDRCHLKTVPNRLVACGEDALIWETSFIPQCNQYKGKLDIEVKPSSPGKNLEVRPGAAEARGSFPGWPPDCADSPCSVEYTVTLEGPSDTLTEDPNIDIWK